MAARRDTHLDAARGLGILLVVFGHLLEPTFLERTWITEGTAFSIWRTIYAFHMPLFFLIAGAADRIAEERRAPAVTTRAVKLVLVAFVFSLLVCVPQVLAGRGNATALVIDHLCGTELGIAPLWFAIALALVRCVYASASAMPNRAAFWSLLALAIAISGACAALKFRVWQVHTLLGTLPFYVLGRLAGAEGLKVRLPAAACGLAALLVLSPDNLVHVASGRYGDLSIFAACALGGSCFVLALATRLSGQALETVAHLGRVSFALFIVNGIVLAASPMMRSLDNAVGVLVVAGVGIPFQLGLAFLLRSPIDAVRHAVDRAVDRCHGRWSASVPVR